ncbi:MAG: aminomethyl-transferring glycine dehydrogenase [Flavobacteriales bacterium]|nr:aminomethyl-transferring glycine dehydrogenase [Flavobacteriales bacterium]
MPRNQFIMRHIGPDAAQIEKMSQTLGVSSVEELINQVVPAKIRNNQPLNIEEGLSEYQYLKHIWEVAQQNKLYHNFIGQGYYGTITPSPILRNIFENPGWYTAYTPYQAEIAQGRMEAILNFQTMVMDLTGMNLANASLLDEATAAAEGMAMAFHMRSREAEKNNVNRFFVSQHCFAQTIDVLKTRAIPLGIELVIGEELSFTPDAGYFGMLLQYPNADGNIHDYRTLIENAHALGMIVVVATDLLSLTLLTPPGEWGADIVVGSSQRFGVPMGYGGPHAAFFATRKEYQRHVPGRIIGVSIDAQGKPALRMSLQTREQHIKRDKATSNICTAQALLAIMASMYAVYHGPKGLKNIALQIHKKTALLQNKLKQFGYTTNATFFDTIQVQVNSEEKDLIQKKALEKTCNFFYSPNGFIGISIDETTDLTQLNLVASIFAQVKNLTHSPFSEAELEEQDPVIPENFTRTSPFLTAHVFNAYHSETELMRYIKKLESKDIALNFSMISLGSCTMKLNAASEMIPLSWPEFNALHPFVPVEQAAGYMQVIKTLEKDLAEITGFDAISLQPNSGAQGEYAGLMVIRAYHQSRGDHKRNVVLIPSSAHGTNPASAVMAGMQVVVVKCDEMGNIDLDDLRAKAQQYQDSLGALMVTYPSTHGVYEETIMEVTEIIHQFGGQVYMDGANMNAQVGLTSPARIGADVCHLNLHKTFAIPHGGGGPGMGPIGVKAHLAPFLPGHTIVKTGGTQAISAVSAAPWGSPLILLISYGYIKMLGGYGLKRSTELAIFNANYMKERIAEHYPILYTGANGRVAHEFIVDCREFKKTAGIEVVDIAKRLMDYGFHAPTVSFPVAGTLMVEPTESESKDELDRFCDALNQIRQEIREIELGIADPQKNVLKMAPHTASVVTADEWNRPYPRSKAAYPLKYIEENKFWPSVSRVDDAYGDRNLVCSCLPLEAYMEEAHR